MISYRKLFFKIKIFLKVVSSHLLYVADIFSFVLSLLTFFVVIYDIGFEQTELVAQMLDNFVKLALDWFAIVYFLKFVLTVRKKLTRFARLQGIVTLILMLIVILAKYNVYLVFGQNAVLKLVGAFVMNKTVVYVLLSYVFLIEFSKNIMVLYSLKTNPYKVFIYSYLLFILCGTGLLMMPNATYKGISVIDAVFTSTSAVCVTGLITVDTATCFTETGKIIILLLLQIGGIGVMTFTSFFVLFSENKFSLQNQFFLRSVVNENQTGQVIKTLVKIILFTMITEVVGAVLIYLNIYYNPFFTTTYDRVFYAVFHAISAFCNAGFSTQTDGLYHISTRFSYNVHLVISFLIIIGGLGFPIVFNYYKYLKFKIRNFLRHITLKESIHHFPRVINVNTKVVVNTTIILIVFGFVTFFIAEYNHSLRGLSIYGKIVTAFFGSVTPRTAGFNTVDMSAISLPFILICMLLMWIGASPSSTGGGIKTSAFALAVLNVVSLGKGKDRIELFRRRISDESVRNAFAVIILSLFVIGLSVFLITLVEINKPLISIIFECISAFGTVGLSLGITADLTTFSKGVLIVVMFIGRIGTLTFIVAFLRKVSTLSYQYPSENIII